MLFVAVDGGEGAGMIMGVSVEKEVASGPWLEEITSLVVALGFICAYHSAKTGDICHSLLHYIVPLSLGPQFLSE